MDLTKIPFADPLTFKFYNPLFNEIGDHSLPISLNTKIDSIRRAFGFPASLNINSSTSIPGKINTQLLELEGSWQVKEASDDNIEVYFKGNGGNFYSLIRNVKLNEISFGGIKYPAGHPATTTEVREHMNTKFNASYPDDEYAVFCAYMPKAYSEDIMRGQYLINEVEQDEYGIPTLKDQLESYWINTVYLFAGTVIEYMFSEYGYKIGRNIFKTNPDLQRLVIFNSYNRQFRFDFDYRQLVPQILCSDFLKAITNRFNIGFFINEKSKTVDIILFDQLISKVTKGLSTQFISKPKVDNNRITGLNFPLNAPDDWSTHSLVGMSDFPIYYTLEEIDTFRDIVPGFLVSHKIYHVKAENTWYKIVNTEGVYSAERLCTNNFAFIKGSGELEVTQYSGIPAMYRYIKTLEWTVEEEDHTRVINTDADFIMPRCDLECTDENFPNKKFPLMFLFNRGIQNGYIVPDEGAPTVLQYPMGSNTIYDTIGDPISGATLSLSWDGEAGLIEKFWKNRIDWEMNIKKIVTGLLTINDINKLIDFSQVIRIEDNNYLVNKVEAEITPRGVRITDAELFRL